MGVLDHSLLMLMSDTLSSAIHRLRISPQLFLCVGDLGLCPMQPRHPIISGARAFDVSRLPPVLRLVGQTVDSPCKVFAALPPAGDMKSRQPFILQEKRHAPA